jgi:hypothetical protein
MLPQPRLVHDHVTRPLQVFDKQLGGNPHINSDAWIAYEAAVTSEFRGSDYGQIVKSYEGEPSKDAARRYSPGWVVAVSKRKVAGSPRDELISTSYIQRSNLNVRMDSCRFIRLTNGYSKKLENHEAAVGLFVACYNLCRVHSTLKMTPAMALGVADHPWSIAEPIDAAEAADDTGRPFTPLPPAQPAPRLPAPAPMLVRERPRFTVIQGGRQ